MTNKFRDQINAISREIFHVAIEQTGTFSVQHAVAITMTVETAARVPPVVILPTPFGLGRRSGCACAAGSMDVSG
jgi:hypothetical protein